MTYGYLIGTAVAGILALAALTAIVWGVSIKPRWCDRKDGGSYTGMWDDEFLKGFALKWAGVVVLLATSGIWVGATFPPFQMKYHSYRPVSGQVTAVGNRFLADGKGSTQEIVVTLNGHDYRCDDTRCSLVKVGDLVSLQCIGVWELHGTPGSRCNFVNDTKGQPS